MRIAERLSAARAFRPQDFLPLVFGPDRIGWIRREQAGRLRAWPDIFIFSTEKGFVLTDGMKVGLFAVVTIALIIGILWATGVQGKVYDFLFSQSWSEAFWTNLIFIILIGVALAAVIRSSGK